MQNGFDMAAVRFFAGLNGHRGLDDVFVYGLHYNTVQTLPIAMIAFAMWLTAPRDGRRSDIIMTGFIAAIVVVALAMASKLFLPARPRPAALGLYPFTRQDFPFDWSSLPSDTLAILSSFTAAMWTAERRWGIVGIAMCVLVAIAKMFAGYHYPTDILIGAGLGVATFTGLWRFTDIGHRANRIVALAYRRAPVAITAALAFVAVSFGTLFADQRVLVKYLLGKESISGETTRVTAAAGGRVVVQMLP
ncbi:phosphatase PAP2 family protein [Sphingomonas sp. RIT328]|uniref:phosphatase PAP2 family protein n=1 Tax=Sphingomonas sp. RIT328 TaxID=1470591 RepID=UPI0004537BD0|nr:phosphatase PAP2 family protein [Sphingomonas sp. RIT328]EZP57163.1 PAP2 superfamily protein [Sphingomonas sp. RIT328]